MSVFPVLVIGKKLIFVLSWFLFTPNVMILYCANFANHIPQISLSHVGLGKVSCKRNLYEICKAEVSSWHFYYSKGQSRAKIFIVHANFIDVLAHLRVGNSWTLGFWDSWQILCFSFRTSWARHTCNSLKKSTQITT